jgi:hypothetical protein
LLAIWKALPFIPQSGGEMKEFYECNSEWVVTDPFLEGNGSDVNVTRGANG